LLTADNGIFHQATFKASFYDRWVNCRSVFCLHACSSTWNEQIDLAVGKHRVNSTFSAKSFDTLVNFSASVGSRNKLNLAGDVMLNCAEKHSG